MTVFSNVAFGLELMGIAREKRGEVVQEALELVGMGNWVIVFPVNYRAGSNREWLWPGQW